MENFDVMKYFKKENGEIGSLMTTETASQFTYIEEDELWVRTEDLYNTKEKAVEGRPGVFFG